MQQAARYKNAHSDAAVGMKIYKCETDGQKAAHPRKGAESQDTHFLAKSREKMSAAACCDSNADVRMPHKNCLSWQRANVFFLTDSVPALNAGKLGRKKGETAIQQSLPLSTWLVVLVAQAEARQPLWPTCRLQSNICRIFLKGVSYFVTLW